MRDPLPSFDDFEIVMAGLDPAIPLRDAVLP